MRVRIIVVVGKWLRLYSLQFRFKIKFNSTKAIRKAASRPYF